jgi:hypothetical protein
VGVFAKYINISIGYKILNNQTDTPSALIARISAIYPERYRYNFTTIYGGPLTTKQAIRIDFDPEYAGIGIP